MKESTKIFAKVLAVILILVAAFWFGQQGSQNQELREAIVQYGYPGIFLVSIISGVNLIVPVPIISFLPAFLEAGLSFWITVLVISMGLSAGDLIGYAVGKVGRELVDEKTTKSRKILYLEKLLAQKRILPLAVLFIYASVVPFPNEVLVAPLAFLGYKVRTIFPVVIIGNIIFNTLSGYAAANVFCLITAC